MKINKIKFCNINSLRGEHEVDFTQEPLVSSGLFAIIGPTGSGKTTLLDVICLALFNRIPRITRNISKNTIQDTGAILTKNATECYAEIEYSCAKGVFKSKWSISTARSGNLRDYLMELANVSTGKILDIKKGDVPASNENNIGLNYDQFVKSILLAQGDFAKFLQSDKKERSALLEKITGTNIYRELGIKAFEKYKEHGLILENFKREQSIFKEQLLDVERRNTLNIQHIALKEMLLKLDTEIADCLRKKALLEEIEKLKNQLSTLETNQQSLIKTQIDFDQTKGERINRHTAIIPYSDKLTEWKNNTKSKADLATEIAEVETSTALINQRMEIVQKSTQNLVGNYFDKKNIASSLDNFYNKTQKLISQKEELRAKFMEKIAALGLLKVHGLTINGKKIPDFFVAFQNSLRETNEQVELLAKELTKETWANPNEQIGILDERIEYTKRAIPLQLRRDEQNMRMAKLAAEIEALNIRNQQLPVQIKDCAQSVIGQQKITENLELKIENQKLKAELTSHRQQLKDGQPCPLCGALTHPFALENSKQENAHDKELKVEKEKLNKLNKTQIEKETEQKQVINQLKNVKEQLVDEQHKLHDIAAILDLILQNFTENELTFGLDKLSEILKKERQKLQEYNNKKDKLRVLEDAKEDVKQLHEAFELGMQKKQELDKLYNKDENGLSAEVQQLRDTWNSLTQLHDVKSQNLKKLQENFRKLLEISAKLNTELLEVLLPLGYNSIEKAMENKLSESAFNQLVNEKNELSQNIKLNEQSLTQTHNTIAEKQKIVASEPLETLLDNLAIKTVMKQEKTEEYNQIDRQLKNHLEFAQKVAHLQTQIDKVEINGQKWVQLNQYIGDAMGNRFNQFAQDLTLSQLIILANLRLKNLSDRYLLDKAKNHEDDSLMVVDQHIGNERRSVKTLSGGETFILSLSLALALSDLASQNIEINSLFIDEGFGSLDPEVLDQTLDTLEKLQSDGEKTIGIISHVEALKERIATKIQLVKNGQGYSTLKIITN